MTQPLPWSARLVKLIASEIKRWRETRGMDQQQLADACEALGYPIGHSELANLESGRRETVSVPELIVLAKALQVPVIQLIVPLGTRAEVEILPGRPLDTEEAMLWLTGWHDPFPDEMTTRIGHGEQNAETGLFEWYEAPYDDAAAPMHLYIEHRQHVTEWERAVSNAAGRTSAGEDSPAFRAEVVFVRGNAERGIRYVRAEMRRRGVTVLPDLPPGLEHLR